MMTKSQTIELDQARRWADKIAAELAPLCDKIEIAGSIRRGRPQVHDIDIVCLPKIQTAVNARISRSASEILGSGVKNLSVRLANGVQIDTYYAKNLSLDLFNPDAPATNWGSLLLCRTGPKEFNIWLASQARKKGMQWQPYKGLHENGRLIAAETESDIFAALGIDYIAPDRRDNIKP